MGPLSGVKGVQARGIAPVSKEFGKSQPLRVLCFYLSRYRLNRLPLLCSESGSSRQAQVPPLTKKTTPRCWPYAIGTAEYIWIELQLEKL